ncbi:MAG: Exodeoxyribonuclease 7 large subunit [Chlamydiia bacterium]|nr:Exodeoxyribonuclease 7 large subunit [Chlamydiia bacterium]MCH9615812.1 Exodeoxyribonuclease 7 large subunit [Chlamydiia bacterium]MCH9628785.1 Exodeoxyribonuclease 7 large subunit [Chlamydiia bacterium]
MEILTVTRLTGEIKKHLETRFAFIKVKGEISNLKVQASGHVYFTLKDENSQISAVWFRGSRGDAKAPQNGDQVMISGELSVYAPRGNYQIIVRKLEREGVGDLLLRLHELKHKLHAKGYFNKERKRPLPTFPKTIGVVTSPTGAVIQDIINVLKRRVKGFHLILCPVKVQGDGSAQEITRAIELFNKQQNVDLIIVGRGGGSLEDLWAFNEECVADAVFHSKIPIISAVGHETDVSICDFVADLRAPTPSAAAELSCQETSSQIDFLNTVQDRLKHLLRSSITHQKARLEKFEHHPLFASPYGILGLYIQKMDDLQNRFDALSPKKMFDEKKEKFHRLVAHLLSIDPKNLLKKGYCIPFDEISRSVIMTTKELSEGQKLHLMFADGTAGVNVDEIECKKTSKSPSNA